jgi:hypothetical protein
MIIDVRIEKLRVLSESEYSAAKQFATANCPNNKQIVAHIYDPSSGFRLVQFIMKGKKADSDIKKSGYYLAYVYNVDQPQFSELGEVHVDKFTMHGFLPRTPR